MADESADLELAVLRLAWRLDALDEWRREVSEQVAGNRRELERLVKADEIADAVADKVNETRTLHLTFVQKAAAFIVGLVAVADGIRGLIH